MAFNRYDVSELLSRCHRRCCICHRFCGVKIETDHIIPTESGGGDEIENAIPVCFECHAEIHSYNDSHPRGRKFQPEELRQHKYQLLRICSEHPEVLVGAIRNADVGPLQALIDELEFNWTVATVGDFHAQGCKFHDQQFLRAIHEGSLSLLRYEIQMPLLEAYCAMGSANSAIDRMNFQPDAASGRMRQTLICAAVPKITAAKNELLTFLSCEGGAPA